EREGAGPGGKVEEAAPDAARALEVAKSRFDRSNKQREPQLDLALALECSAQVAAMQARFADAAAHLERATEHAEQAIALSGLNAGDTVITTGILQLRPGMGVNVTRIAN
ncbi:MAG: hypothetical protein ACKOAR_03380, partial [Bacteroidota bacterium]